MADARSLVESYFHAWQRNDFAEMRSALDERVNFAGPIDTFDTADAFLQSIQGLSQIKDDLVIKKIWADEPECWSGTTCTPRWPRQPPWPSDTVPATAR